MEKMLMEPNVKLISYSKSEEHETIQELIAYCARVSNPANQSNKETTEKLLRYLIRHKHWSPFETASICLEITTTRDIARQILRHRSFAFQEFSQRYANPIESLAFVQREARLQDTKNRQNSIELDFENDTNRILAYQWENLQNDLINKATDIYKWAIDHGIAKEQARAVLPEGLIESRIYMAGTVRSWIHYCQLRCSNGTQKEHMEVARKCAEVISTVFPLMMEIDYE
jgi:thymidylate synthase (FAD)